MNKTALSGSQLKPPALPGVSDKPSHGTQRLSGELFSLPHCCRLFRSLFLIRFFGGSPGRLGSCRAGCRGMGIYRYWLARAWYLLFMLDDISKTNTDGNVKKRKFTKKRKSCILIRDSCQSGLWDTYSCYDTWRLYSCVINEGLDDASLCGFNLYAGLECFTHPAN